MSVQGALYSAVSGMQSQSNALSAISQNISNSATVGYQSVTTNFEDMVLTGSGSATGNIANSLGGVKSSNYVNTAAGQVTSTGVSTDVAVDGNGYLVVNTNSDASSGSYLATLAGSFRPDSSGNLVNAAGYFLQGVPLDADGTAVGGNQGNTLSSLSTVNIDSVSSDAAATSKVGFSANLPSSETAYATTTPSPSTSTVTYYDSLGSAHTMTLSFTPTQAASGSAQTNTWTLNVSDDSGDTGSVALNFFGSNGLDANNNSGTAGTLSTATGASGALGGYNTSTGDLTFTTADNQTISLNIGTPGSASGLTQYDGSSYQTNGITADGSAYGTLSSVSISKTGVVNASYSNGMSRPIYQLKLATVPNAQGLTQVSGDAYAFTNNAGTPILNSPGTGGAGSTDGGALEGSNVDITTELTNLIQTQRAYQSNSTVVQVGNSMLQTADQLMNPL